MSRPWRLAAGDGRLALFSECLGERVSELAVVLLKSLVSVDGGFEPAEQRGVGGALSIGWRGGRPPLGPSPELFDLGSQVWLGVEPGAGDAGLSGDGIEGVECDRFGGPGIRPRARG